MKIAQSLGIFTQINKKASKQSGLLVEPYALEQHNFCGMICILHLVFLYHKKKLPPGSSMARTRRHKRNENNGKNICSKTWSSLSSYSLDMDYFATFLKYNNLYFVCSYGAIYSYITSFPVLINKAQIFCYSYSMYIYTTSGALDSHMYPWDLMNTWCATSCQNFQESCINSDI